VPIDWDHPYGEKVQLGMLRHKASKPAQRVGSLIFNPGGPGDTATIYVKAGSALFGEDIANRFDIVGLDPRGVGLSSPIQCDPEIYNQRVDYWPSNQTGLDALVRKFQTLGESCLNMTGPLVKHMDSISVAKDMEAIRQGLGDEKLNYIGWSYGTLLGQTYAELFPQNIRTMVFDGNMDHSTDPISYLTVKSFTYESELIRFSEWCSQSKSCPLNGTSNDVLKVFDDLVEQGNKEPIPAPSCKGNGCLESVTGSEIRNNVNSLLFVKYGIYATWTKLGQYLLDAKRGNATGLSTTLATSSKSDSFQSAVISCSDWYHPEASLVDLKYKNDLASTMWPHVGTGDYGLNRCIGWPFPQVNKEHKAKIDGTPRILLVNSQFDPSCSYIWANGLQEQISNSTLLTRRGDGHTSYMLHGEAWEAMNAYIANLTIPADNAIVNS
jgi:pimeloyl-ACP methyl ester carboxylesterase